MFDIAFEARGCAISPLHSGSLQVEMFLEYEGTFVGTKRALYSAKKISTTESHQSAETIKQQKAHLSE